MQPCVVNATVVPAADAAPGSTSAHSASDPAATQNTRAHQPRAGDHPARPHAPIRADASFLSIVPSFPAETADHHPNAHPPRPSMPPARPSLHNPVRPPCQGNQQPGTYSRARNTPPSANHHRLAAELATRRYPFGSQAAALAEHDSASEAAACGQSRQRRTLAQHDPSGLRAVAGAASATSAAGGSPPRKRAPRRRRGRPWPGRGMSPLRSPTRSSPDRESASAARLGSNAPFASEGSPNGSPPRVATRRARPSCPQTAQTHHSLLSAPYIALS